jgi:hypothetical protein
MLRTILVAWVVVGAGCAGEGGGGKGKGDDPSCNGNSDCPDGMACLSYGSGPGACAAECSASVDECGANASCSGVGSLSIEVCQQDEDLPEEGEAPSEDERPRIACQTDEDCAEYGSRAVCAEWQGLKDCTVLCEAEEDCTPPSMGGMTFDFMACLEDEGDRSRRACLPDEACFADPFSCMQMPGF